MNTKRLAAGELLKIGAVFLRPDEPFTWASGIKSPIYCDNRLILTAPDTRDFIEKCFVDMLVEKYKDAEALMGTSTAGIPHAAIVAHILGIPMGYVRGKAKDHGRTNKIEGRLEKGEKVVVIEDLISTAGSSINAVSALREAGADVLGIISIFSYGLAAADENLRKADVRNDSLCDFDTLVDVAVEDGYIRPEDAEKLFAFRNDPENESWMNA